VFFVWKAAFLKVFFVRFEGNDKMMSDIRLMSGFVFEIVFEIFDELQRLK
jgi:hypothetical protein